MATELTPVQLKLNGYLDLSDFAEQEDVADEGTDYKFTPTRDRFMIYVETTDETSSIDKVTVKAGDYFQGKVLGEDNDLEIEETLGEGDSLLIGFLESARFLNEDGEIEFTVEATADAHDAKIGVIEVTTKE